MRRWSSSLALLLLLPACGGGAPAPTLPGRAGMLHQRAVARECEEAKKCN